MIEIHWNDTIVMENIAPYKLNNIIHIIGQVVESTRGP